MKLHKSVCVTGASTVSDADEIMILTNNGQAVRSPANSIRVIRRSSSGVHLRKLIGISKIITVDDEERSSKTSK
jgi:DNA gyrase/topoisomerase IV subunit A